MVPAAYFKSRIGRADAILLASLSILIALRARSGFQLDEERFVQYADNLTQGFYADAVDKFLWNGPGYPLFLLPFRILNIPLLAAKLCNAVFLIGTLLYLRKLLKLYLPESRAVFWSYAGFGYMVLFGFSWSHLLMTESISAFLVAGYAFHFCAAEKTGSRKDLTLSCGLAAALALTKFFFGYVLVLQLLAGAVGVVVFGKRIWRGPMVAGSALLLCAPYLVYTQKLTGQVFYWGNTGGSQFYTLTLPERHLLGDVIPMNMPERHPELFPSVLPVLAAMRGMDQVASDKAFRRAGWDNVRRYPAKVFKNWRANVNRLVFDYPFSRFPGSHSREGSGNLSFLFSPIWFALLLGLHPSWKFRRRYPPELVWMMGFATASLFGLSLVSAYARFVFPLLPILLAWLPITAEHVRVSRGGEVA